MGQPGASTTTRDATQNGQLVGLFIGSWEIGKESMPGAPTLTVDLMFDAPRSTVSGRGRLFQAVNPPLEVNSRCEGDYTYMTVMPHDTHILITLTGYPVTKWPQGGGVGPVLEPNLQVRMVLESDWRSGTATYSYRASDGEWHQVESVPVREQDVPIQAGRQ
jgi:Domain of unknown function (DUF1842)